MAKHFELSVTRIKMSTTSLEPHFNSDVTNITGPNFFKIIIESDLKESKKASSTVIYSLIPFIIELIEP